jgi:uncharacterized protein
MQFLKILYIILGTLALLIGITGVFVPGLPTTPFLLLTAWLYLKGSRRLHNRLLSSRLLGDYIREYQKQHGMTLRQKVSSLGVMWFMILISVLFLINDQRLSIAVLVIGLIGTMVMGFWVRTARKDDP